MCCQRKGPPAERRDGWSRPDVIVFSGGFPGSAAAAAARPPQQDVIKRGFSGRDSQTAAPQRDPALGSGSSSKGLHGSRRTAD